MQHAAQMSGIPTIREIAVACGCNNSTVSRALSNKPSIPPATRDRILAVAQEMGWKRNPLASAYMNHLASTRPTHYQATLGYIVSSADTGRFEDLDKFNQRTFHGARARAAHLGYTLELIYFGDFAYNVRRLARLLRNRGIPGFLIHGGTLPQGHMLSFDWEAFAAATWGFSVLQPILHRSAFNMSQGIRLALVKLREKGYRRIGMVMSDQYDSLVDHGFLYPFLYEEKNHPPGEWIRACRFNRPSPASRAKIRRWLELHRPEVIFGEMCVWETLQEMKWLIPGDISYVSVAWSPNWPDIGGIDQCPEIVGANAVDLVSTQLLQNERGLPSTPKLLLNDGRWIDAHSIPSLTTAPV